MNPSLIKAEKMSRTTDTTIEIITEQQSWDFHMDSIAQADFYHSYDYHTISKNWDEEAILIKYTDENQTILLPLLIRKIDGTQYKDATSVYGYPGPIITKSNQYFDLLGFRQALQKLFLEMNLVSVFSRLNPYIPFQDEILKGLGAIVTVGNVINIDLTRNLEAQEQAYQKRLKTYINKARRLCTVRKAETDGDMLQFIAMYYENMRRVNAKEKYFFDETYFFDLLNSTQFKTEVFLTTLNETNEIISGAMFIKKCDIVQYHLSGTKEQFVHLNPVKLMIDEMRIIATAENYCYFNLGGGVGSKEDSLFKFKSNFSKDFKPFKVWKYIVDLEVYGKLIEEKPERPYSTLHTPFPLYRCDH